jgi:hypothetical protein
VIVISNDAEDLRAALLGAGDGMSTLATVCIGVAALLPITGVSVVLMSPGPVQGVASANERMAKEVLDLEFTVGEGPGIDAFNSSVPVLVEELASEHERWPLFAGAALRIGVRSIYSFPLQFGAITLGILTLSSGQPQALVGTDLSEVPLVTEVVTSVILHMQAEDATDSLAWSLDVGDHRAVVHQATGMIATQLGCGLDEALLRLRGRAFADETAIDDVAEAVIQGQIRFEPA